MECMTASVVGCMHASNAGPGHQGAETWSDDVSAASGAACIMINQTVATHRKQCLDFVKPVQPISLACKTYSVEKADHAAFLS